MIPLLLAMISRFPGFERELRLLPILLRPGQVAVDVGASLGVYSIPMAIIVGASGAVFAFEPRPNAARRLQRICRSFGLDQLRVHSTALGAAVGHQRLVIPRRKRSVPGRSFLHPGCGVMALDDDLRLGQELEVPVSTLDQSLQGVGRPIDFIKCDVEGAEHDVFTGGVSVLSNDRPTILCEIEERHTHRYGGSVERVLALFARYEYDVIDISLHGYSARNALLVPRERAFAPTTPGGAAFGSASLLPS